MPQFQSRKVIAAEAGVVCPDDRTVQFVSCFDKPDKLCPGTFLFFIHKVFFAAAKSGNRK